MVEVAEVADSGWLEQQLRGKQETDSTLGMAPVF